MPAPRARRPSEPPKEDLRRLLRDLRKLCARDAPICDAVLRAYRAGSFDDAHISHRVDIKL
jgi:hypothetical protein